MVYIVAFVVLTARAARRWAITIRRWTVRILRRGLEPQHVHVPPDVRFARLTWWRAAIGTGAIIVASVYWRGLNPGVAGDLASEFINRLITTAAVLCLVALLPCVLLLAVAPARSRRTLARYLWIPARVPLAAASMTGVVFVVGNPRLLTSTGVEPVDSTLRVAIPLMTVIVGVIFLATLPTILIMGVPLLLRHYGRAADGHPTLPALISITLGGALALISLLEWFYAGPNPAFPWIVALLLAAGGPVSTITLGSWELWTLHRRGIGIRWNVTATSVATSTGQSHQHPPPHTPSP